MMIIYVLKLEKGKFYVGRTCHYERRMKDHFSGNGSYWTKRYKPIEVIRKVEHGTAFDEDKVLKETMMQYGIDNVRGGSYVMNHIPIQEKKIIEKEIRFAQDLCVLCGSDKHFISDCDTMVIFKCEVCDFEFESENECEFHVKNCVVTNEISTQTDNEEVNQEVNKKSSCCCIIC
jgi:predicted GIY-YIG superfamily endonuclease